VRVWNHIPNILAPAQGGDAGVDRYMAFNAGRFEAYERWYGTAGFGQRVPTASGVGHEGHDLFIHALAARQAGEAVDNPRQVPPYRYSARYGRIPPCFARATQVLHRGQRWLLAGGTSSVHGEASVHVGDLEGQIRETLLNLAALTSSAQRQPPAERLSEAGGALQCYRELRVYHVRRQDQGVIAEAIARWLGQVQRVEFMAAVLCRADLLVEIEGLARV